MNDPKSKDRIAQWEVERRAVITTVLLVAWLCMGWRAAHSGETEVARSDAAPALALQVGFKHGLLTIDARQEPWKRVLDQIAEKTGIRFRSATPPAGSVSVFIEPLPVRQALERLLGPGADFICRYGRATDSGATPSLPQEVWILGGERFARSEAVSNDGGHGPAADDDTVRSTLEAALADRDASVRGQALQALAVRGGAEALEHVRQGMGDSDPGVRIVALERLEPTDEGIALMQEALADVDETVRSLAASRLKEAGNRRDTE